MPDKDEEMKDAGGAGAEPGQSGDVHAAVCRVICRISSGCLCVCAIQAAVLREGCHRVGAGSES